MNREINRSDRKRPRTFTPPPPRRPKRQRPPLGWPHAGWRDRVVPSLARAFCAITFAGYAAFDERFGDAALVVVSLGLCAFIGSLAFVAVKMQSAFTFGLLVADAVSLALIPSTLWIASGIKVADERFGGNAGHFLLSALAVLGLTLIVFCIAAIANWDEPDRAALAAMAGGCSVIAVLGAGTRFSAGQLPDGMSFAWMAAAALTLADGMVSPRSRGTLRVAGIAGFVAFVIVLGLSADNQGGANTSNNVTASLLALVVAGALLALPRATNWLQVGVMSDAIGTQRPREFEVAFHTSDESQRYQP
jgi:hypothetical protein